MNARKLAEQIRDECVTNDTADGPQFNLDRAEELLRISDEVARSSESRPGVGTAVESHSADENRGSAETGGEKA